MTKSDIFTIGMALSHIEQAVDDKTRELIKPHLDKIVAVIDKQPIENKEETKI